MQIKKETIKIKILQAAVREFEKCGFEKASLRNIAKASGITVGNLYRYFKNKEMLFYEITTPILEQIRSFIAHHHEWIPKDEELNIPLLLQTQCKNIGHFIVRHRSVLRILIDGSSGTRHATAKKQLITFMENHVTEHIEDVFDKSKASKYKVTARMISVGFMEGLFEIVRKPYPVNQMALAIEQYIQFYFQGFLQAFGISDPQKWLLENKRQ